MNAFPAVKGRRFKSGLPDGLPQIRPGGGAKHTMKGTQVTRPSSCCLVCLGHRGDGSAVSAQRAHVHQADRDADGGLCRRVDLYSRAARES